MTRFFPGTRWTSLAAFSLMGAAFPLSACSGEDPGLEEASEPTGSVGLELDVGSSIKLDTVSWEISGNGLSRTGSFNVKNSSKIAGTIGGIPAGAGYTISLS